MASADDQTNFEDLIEGSFDNVVENIDELCEMIETHIPYTYQTTKQYLSIRNKLIENVKALEFYYKGTMKK